MQLRRNTWVRKLRETLGDGGKKRRHVQGEKLCNPLCGLAVSTDMASELIFEVASGPRPRMETDFARYVALRLAC